MNINRNNYEAFFLDYIEQRLNDEQKLELCEFLKQHPDLQSELNGFQMIYLSPPSIEYPHKNHLKMNTLKVLPPLNAEYAELWIIAYYEGDLLPNQIEQLKNFISNNPEFDELFHIYEKMQVKPDRQITYAHKSELKRKSRVISLHYFAIPLAIAAALTGFWILLTRHSTSSHQQHHIAQKAHTSVAAQKYIDYAQNQPVREFYISSTYSLKDQPQLVSSAVVTTNNVTEHVPVATPDLNSDDTFESIPMATIETEDDTYHLKIFDKKEQHQSIVAFEQMPQTYKHRRRPHLQVLVRQTEKTIERLEQIFASNTRPATMIESGIKIINALFDDIIITPTDTTSTRSMFCLSSICINFP